MTDFSKFPTASFDGIPFPISRCTVKGGIRHHVHEFPHSPGGEPEKMGRKLYTITMTIHMHDVAIINAQFGENRFGDLWPGQLRQLRVLWEGEATRALVIPSIGSIPAFATEWEQVADLERALSGEDVTVTFLEDEDAAFFANLAFATEPETFAAFASTLTAAQALADFNNQPIPSIFDAINDIATAIQGSFDTVDAFNNVLLGKLEYLSQLCSQADRDVAAFQNPVNYQLLDATKDLWAAANDLAKDITRSQRQIQVYTTPRLMAVADASTAIFGDASHTLELLNMNPIEDAFAIPAGTSLRYLALA